MSEVKESNKFKPTRNEKQEEKGTKVELWIASDKKEKDFTATKENRNLRNRGQEDLKNRWLGRKMHQGR